MKPRDSIRLRTVYLEQVKEWLSNTEGPDLIEGTEAAKPDRLLGMAVSFDPVCYYPPLTHFLKTMITIKNRDSCFSIFMKII